MEMWDKQLAQLGAESGWIIHLLKHDADDVTAICETIKMGVRWTMPSPKDLLFPLGDPPGNLQLWAPGENSRQCLISLKNLLQKRPRQWTVSTVCLLPRLLSQNMIGSMKQSCLFRTHPMLPWPLRSGHMRSKEEPRGLWSGLVLA